MKIDGDIKIGEAARWAGKACGRLQRGVNPWLAVAVIIALIFGFGITVSWLADDGRIPEYLPSLLIIVFGVVALVSYVRLHRAVSVQSYTTALTDRGVTNPLPASFTIKDDVLIYEIGVVTTTLPWSAVSELFLVGPYWVVMAQGSAHFLPRRYFTTPQQEKDFLGLFLARMTAEARARSQDAERVVG